MARSERDVHHLGWNSRSISRSGKVVEQRTARYPASASGRVLSRMFVLSVVGLSWIFFRALTAGAAFRTLASLAISAGNQIFSPHLSSSQQLRLSCWSSTFALNSMVRSTHLSGAI